jgi:hypothetical protein
MMNHLGKGLVLVTAAVSILFLAWAVAIYTQTIDWGWKDPRTELKDRVPSEIDKRLAALQESLRLTARAQAEVNDNAKELAIAEKDYTGNVHLYRAKLSELYSAKGAIKVQELTYDKGKLLHDPKDRRTAPPAFGKVIEGPKKSMAEYQKEFNALQKDLDDVTAKINEVLKKESELTVNLNGKKDENGKLEKVGLYALLEKEKMTQDQIKAELDYLQPLWVQELVDAQLLLERTGRLERRVAELKKYNASEK